MENIFLKRENDLFHLCIFKIDAITKNQCNTTNFELKNAEKEYAILINKSCKYAK